VIVDHDALFGSSGSKWLGRLHRHFAVIIDRDHLAGGRLAEAGAMIACVSVRVSIR
jgi:hypothetical protein